MNYIWRVLRLDIPSGKAELVLKGLNFANGIQILPDRQSLIVSECSMARIIRFYFDGPKKGNSEIFIENLPGFPDNVLDLVVTLLNNIVNF